MLSTAISKFPGIADQHVSSIEAKAKRLIPWSYDVVSTWADNALRGSSEVTSAVAKKMKEYSDLKTADLLDSALEEARFVPKTGILARFRQKQTSILTFKPNLQLCKANLSEILVAFDTALSLIQSEHSRLQVSLISLVAVIEVKGLPSDRSLEPVVSARRVLLQQAVQQANLLILQLTEISKAISSQLATINNLLYVTIPAFEVANASSS